MFEKKTAVEQALAVKNQSFDLVCQNIIMI